MLINDKVQSLALPTEFSGIVIHQIQDEKKPALKSRFFNVAPQLGLEPRTNGLTVRCSTN